MKKQLTQFRLPGCDRQRQRGLALIPWLLLVAGLLTLVLLAVLVVVPRYQTRTLQPRFAEIMQTMAPYKAAIETCAKNGSCVATGALAGLDVGVLGVPRSISTTYLERVTVSPKGIITAHANRSNGLAGETFILTPTLVNGTSIAWSVSGSCKTRPDGAIC